jgi:hypothetical protein
MCAGRSGLDESAADGVAGQLDAVVHVELLEDVRAVALDGLRADDGESAMSLLLEQQPVIALVQPGSEACEVAAWRR